MSSATSAIELIRQRAKDLLISSKAHIIVQNMGTFRESKHGTIFNYRDELIHIVYDDYGQNISIDYKDSKMFVMQTGQIIKAVLMEEWLNYFNVLYEKAENLNRRKEKSDGEEIQFRDYLPKEYNSNNITEEDKKKVEEFCKGTPWNKIPVSVKESAKRMEGEDYQKAKKFFEDTTIYYVDEAKSKERTKPPRMRLLVGETLLELREKIKTHLKCGWIELHREERTADLDENAFIHKGYNYVVMEKEVEE